MTGTWPKAEIDHIDRNGLNNRWFNLREASRSQNAGNTKTHTDNKTGFKGVCPNHKRFSAMINEGGKTKYLGTFDTPEEAHEAYMQAARDLFGEFASDGV